MLWTSWPGGAPSWGTEMRVSWMVWVAACGGGVSEGIPEPTDTGTPPTGPALPTFEEPIALCINEVMTDNSGALEVDGTWPDWIEIHNPTGADVPLDGWLIHDADGSAYRFEDGTGVSAGEFLVLYASDSEGAGHVPFKLDNDGDSVSLVRPDNSFIQVDVPASVADWAFSRSTDCCVGDCWTGQLWGTPGVSNEVEDGTPTE